MNVVQIEKRGARGESFADVARRVGSIAGTPVPADATDVTILNLLTDAFSDVVAAAGFSVIASVRAATTANITLSGAQTIDGVSIVAGNRVLVKNQSTSANNGIYAAASGAWTRATDFDSTPEVLKGSFVSVTEGTVNIGSAWVLVTADPITVGTTAQSWQLFRSFDDFVTKAGTETLSHKTFSGATGFATNGSRIGITAGASPITPISLVQIENDNANSAGLVVRSTWQGSTGTPYNNNDSVLSVVQNKVLSDSLNRSWAVSAANAYHDIPVGVTDSGERTGVLGWATSVAGLTGYDHEGTLATQIGVQGAAGFQSPGTASTAVVVDAFAVRGLIYSDSAGATIENAKAGVFVSDGGDGIIEHNVGVYARALNGTEKNYSFLGEGGLLFNQDRIAAGNELTYGNPAISAFKTGNAVEFGYPAAGYSSNIGSTFSVGYPFLGLCCEADYTPGVDTFTTRGKKGWVILNDLLGGLVFGKIPNASASGQSQVEKMRINDNGNVVLQETLIMKSKTPASASAAGVQGEVCWDASYIYVCTATNTWKRVAIATW